MKFLVLGATGMAGHTITIYLKEQGHNVLGFARREVSYVPCVIGNAMDTEFLRELITHGSFDSIINCIGILNQSAEQHKERAVFLNSYFPHFLADVTSETNTQVIHMSTDCVFSGKTGNYTEDSLRDGETFYDRTKALGELEDGKNITFRNSIVGPDIDPEGIGLLNWFMKQNGEIKGYTGAMWTGMTTLQLAKIMEKAAEQKAHGLYNMVPDHNISKFELLKLFNHYIRNNNVQIRPYDGFTADKTLVRTRFDFAEIVPGYEIMVREMADWMSTHSTLYPHYAL
ncbi:MAG: sugar nucleotide-binding protein [Clostridiaceae bacterium]|nr:sugar nucleotide-binding protein [Clostridiaceae bacterium]